MSQLPTSPQIPDDDFDDPLDRDNYDDDRERYHPLQEYFDNGVRPGDFA